MPLIIPNFDANYGRVHELANTQGKALLMHKSKQAAPSKNVKIF